MVDVPASSSEQGDNPIELAVPVSRRVAIQSIVLADCRAKRSPQANLAREGLRFNCNIAGIKFGKEPNSNRFIVNASFSAIAEVREEKEAEEEKPHADPDLIVEASFILIYSVDSFDGLDEKNIEAFAVTNGVFNAWPYWREFVQNTTVRMGLSPLTIPVFRF
jgi:hypothetical protein